MKKRMILAAAFACGAGCALAAGEPLRGRDLWGGQKPRPAVVHAVGDVADDPMRLSLRGEWDFYAATKGDFNMRNMSGSTAWKMRDLHKEARKIQVPGCWEAQGVGSNGMSVAWKCWWDASPKPIRHVYSGSAWYRKVVRIPDAWKGRRIWIKVGGVNAQAWLWVNERQTAWIDGSCGTCKYEITDRVTAGEDVKIVMDVTNELPSRRGCFNSMNTWGGIVRDIELEATPQVFIDDAWVRGDFDRHVAEVHVGIDGGKVEKWNGGKVEKWNGGQVEKWNGGKVKVRVTVQGETVESTIEQSNNQSILKIPLRDFRPWSPERPNLYWATIELMEDGRAVQTRRERFGVRKLEVRGKELYLNGEPFFARGAGWHWIDPIDGMLPPDRAYFRERIRKVRDAGFNIVRFHTSCFWPEFFEVADELGLMAEAELPYYTDFPCDFFEFDPLRDARELWCNYRRHPSFAIYSGGNEGWYGPELSARFYEYVRTMDPDRLVMGEDTWHNPRTNLKGTSDFAGGPVNVWPRGSYDPARPFICHEYLNLSVKLDSRLENRFTGVWLPPVTRKERETWLASFGLDLAFGDRLQDSQHAFQKLWQKYGIEAARADPNCDGYFYWSLQDVACPQKGVMVGQALYDSFWGEKPCGQTTSGFRQFNGPSCLLLDLKPAPHLYPAKTPGKWADFTLFVDDTNRVCEAGDVLPARFLLAHYESAPIREGRLSWCLRAAGQTLASGGSDVADQLAGPTREVAAAQIRIPNLEAATRASLEVVLKGRGQVVSNAWDVWLFPKGPSRKDLIASAAAKGVVIAAEGSDEAREAEEDGKDLIVHSNQDGPGNITLGWWYFGSQMGVVLNDHPALKYLPHDGLISPLLFRILKEGRKLPVSGIAQKDLIVAGEGGSACYLYLAERRGSGGGRVFVVSGLDILSGYPEGNAILRGLLETF